MIRNLLAILGDVLLNPRCRYGCGERVHPLAIVRHEYVDHAGERLPGGV